MTNKKWFGAILIVVTVLIIAGAIAAYTIWNKPRRDIKDEKGIAITSIALFDSFNNDEEKANALYLNKVLEVTGEVKQHKKKPGR
jgi:hypothetical protein